MFQSTIERDLGPSIGSTINQLDLQSITSIGATNQIAAPWYSDQVLPFDITLAGANEYGAMCSAKIFGVEILNEGSGVSIDDALTEDAGDLLNQVSLSVSSIRHLQDPLRILAPYYS